MAYSWSNPRWGPRWRPLLVTSEASSGATTHKIYLIVLRRKRLSTNGKIVLKYCKTYQISGKGFRQNSKICVYVRGLSWKCVSSPSFSVFLLLLLLLLLYSFNCLLRFTKINQHSVAGSILLLRFRTRCGHIRISSVCENSWMSLVPYFNIHIFSPCHNKGSKLASVILRHCVLYTLINSLSKLLWGRIKLHFFVYVFSVVLGFSVLRRKEWRSLETDVQPLLKWSSRFRLDDGRRRMHKSSRLLRAVNTRGQESGVQCLSNERHQLQRSWREFL